MAKRKKRGAPKKKKDDSPDDVSECESLDRPPSAKKVAASSTSQLEDEMDQISSFTSVALLNSSKSESGEIAALSSHFLCNYCEFSADTKAVLITHMRQHMIKCPHCSFSSLSRIEVSRHCKYEHEEDMEGVSQEVDSSSTDCEMDKDPCSACVYCNFMTYSTEHLEKHTAHKHPTMLAKSVAKMITKQISADVRRDDALFYLAISNDDPVKPSGCGYSSSVTEKCSGPVVSGASLGKSEDVKPEVKCTSDTKSVSHNVQKMGQFLDPVKMHLESDTHSDNLALGQRIGNRNMPTKVETSSTISLPVKVETMYCLTCPYSNVYIEKLKCHTIVQHPVGAAAATYNSTGEGGDAQDITFFCVREDCNHSSSDCLSYQKHIIDCCACHKTLKVLEKERLRSTITYILEHQKKYRLAAEEGFYDFASPFLGFSLPPTLTGIAPSAVVEDQPFHQTKNGRSLSNSQSSVANIDASSESSSLTTGLSYQTPGSYLTSATVSSSSSQSTGSQTSDMNQAYFPQQLQNITSNIHSSSNNSGNYQNQIFNSHDSVNMPVQMNMSSTKLPSDGRSFQPSQNHNTASPFHPQNQRDYPQPSPAKPLMRNYQDTPQVNVSWPAQNQTASVRVHSEQNFNMAFSNQVLDDHTGLMSQNNAACNSSANQSRPDMFPLVQNAEVNTNFIPASSHNSYTPTSRHLSQDTVNSSNFSANINHSMAGGLHESSVNRVSNPMTSNAFYEQQAVSNVFSTTNMDLPNADTQPQPKMLDLLSDSYSILLSDEFGSEDPIPEVCNNSLNQPQQAPLCPSSYQQEMMVNAQSQVVASQSPSRMPQGHSGIYQAMQHEEPNFQQPAVDRSQLASCGNQFSFPSSNQSGQVANMVSNLGSDSDFQTTQSSAGYGALQSTLTPEQSSSIQPAPHQSPNVPNFLGAPGVPSSDRVQVQQHMTSSFCNPHPSALQPAVLQSGQCTPPKHNNTTNKYAGASPLSPSIYLSGQVPRHRRTNWTDADMRPRGIMLPGAPPRSMSLSVPGPQSHVNQRLFVPGKRGLPRAPRMPLVRGRMPVPRMPANRVGDDDDVIVTAVTRTRIPPSLNRQPGQHADSQIASRGVPSPASRGRGQAVPVQIRQKGQVAGVRVPYPVPPPPPHTHKHFDISKHFEDLACVVNASADEGEGGSDDIEIVCVTPGKEKEKINQPKAVDASKFSFCCVHCGKDQGSKNILKQHMRARHRQSLLGALKNIETGQILFFCPQLTCEFMTYDEKRLCEHLSKCFDLDKSKPFDFGTAIKNLKSLKIRQLDVRTMGRSHDNPIDLDGQGMKDNFSSSLNDAFGDIVVNASGRHMVRQGTPPHQAQLPHIQPRSSPTQSGAIRSKVQFRNPSSPSAGARLRLPGFAEQGGMANRIYRPMTTFRHPGQQNFEIRASPRHFVPTNLRMEIRNIREMHPRISASVRQPVAIRSAQPSFISTPTRLPFGGQQDPVIVIDVDSPERPEEMDQNDSVVSENPDIPNQIPVSTSDIVAASESLPAQLPQHIRQFPENMDNINYQEQYSVASDEDLVYSDPVSASPKLNPPHNLSSGDTTSNSRTTTPQSSMVISHGMRHTFGTITGKITDDSESALSDAHIEQNTVSVSNVASYTTSGFASSTSCQEDTQIPETAPLDSDASACHDLPYDRMRSTTTSYSADGAPVPTYAMIKSSVTDSQITECSTASSDIPSTPQSASDPSVTSIPPSSSHLNVPSGVEYFDEEERVNAVVLEKVFAKVPNMPKNLSRRLVVKFKQYATYRGVKITSDSKVIDEFVSKIYYKGSAADKAASKAQPDSCPSQPDGVSENPSVANLVTSSAPELLGSSLLRSGNSVAKDAEEECESSREPSESHSVKTVQEAPISKGSVGEELSTVVSEISSEQTSANEIITTHVILAERNLQFSPTFASIALKSSAASTLQLESRHDLGVRRKRLETKQVTEPNLTSSAFESGILRSRSSSANDSQVVEVVHPFRRSSSFPLHACSVSDLSEAVKSSDKLLTEKLAVVPSLPDSVVTAANNMFPSSKLSLTAPEDNVSDVCTSKAETVQQQNLPFICKEQFKEELEIAFPPAPESEIVPILITSSVDDIVSRHPALEVDIAGKPLKQEQLDEDNRELDNESHNTGKDLHENDNDQSLSMKLHTHFKKVTAKYSDIIDRTTGKLLFKKTKRGRPRKLFGSVEEKPEVKDITAEELVVRRSSRSRKPVNKNYQSEANEIDELMSDDDEEYNIDDDNDDYDTDTDGDWHGDGSEQPPKKKLKKMAPPPDPTAFDPSTKGKFKCWLCKKFFSRCSFAKSHIIQKHRAGLCSVYLEKSEEDKTPCLLLFCPRKCRYVTLSCEGIQNHVKSCSESLLTDEGEEYLEINRQFLDSKYSELQGRSLETILNTSKARKPKDPTKPAKAKKPKVNMDIPAVVPVAISCSEASASGKLDNIVSSLAPSNMHSESTSTPAVTSAAAHLSASFVSDSLPDHKARQKQQQAVSCVTATDLEKSAISKMHLSLPQKPQQHINPQQSGQQRTTAAVAPEVTRAQLTGLASSLASSAPRPLTVPNPHGHQIFTTSAQTHVSSSILQHSAQPPISKTSLSVEHEDDIVYMIEDNGTICLK